MVKSSEIKEELTQLEKEINPIAEQMNEQISIFGEELVVYVKRWMEREVRRKIEDNAEKVNSGEISDLSKLKSDLNTLFESLSDICSKIVSDKTKYPHNISGGGRYNSSRSGSNEGFFPSSFRLAIGHLGGLLNSYNLIGEKPGYTSTWKMAAGTYEYAISPGFDAREFNSIEKYDSLKQKHKELSEKIVMKQNELEKALAVELWDSA